MDIDATPLYDDAVTRLIKLLKDNFKEIKTVYDGDPIVIPKSNLPCIMVEKTNTAISVVNAYTGHDRFVDQINVTVAFNKSDDLGATDEANLTERKLRRFVEGREINSGQWAAGTIMYVLRTHLTLDDYQFNSDVNISYDINPLRPDTVDTAEAIITVTGEGKIPVLIRN
jgi:hypothetical protein